VEKGVPNGRDGKIGVYSLSEQRVADLAKLEHADPAPWLEDAVRLGQNGGEGGAVSDPERDGVEIDRVVGDVGGEGLRVAMGKSDLGSCGPARQRASRDE
jgi:hypothetical protein